MAQREATESRLERAQKERNAEKEFLDTLFYIALQYEMQVRDPADVIVEVLESCGFLPTVIERAMAQLYRPNPYSAKKTLERERLLAQSTKWGRR